MTADHRLRSLLVDLGDADGPDALLGLARDRGPRLLRTPGVATALLSDGEIDESRRMILFGTLADRARIDAENGGRRGQAFLAEAENAIAALIGNGSLDVETGSSLVRAYATAELEVPEVLISFLVGGASTAIAADGFPEELEARIAELHRETGGDAYLLFSFLNDLLAGMPVQLRPAVVRHVAGPDQPSYGNLAAYWLLHPDPDVRVAAAGCLGEKARRGTLDTAAASALPLIRTWLPADRALPVLDAAIRDARRHDLIGPLTGPALRPSRLAASIPDGAGSQSLVLLLEGADGPAAALVLLKAGHGVRDAFLIRGPDAADAMSFQTTGSHSSDIALDALEPALSEALAEGLAAGNPPPPGLLDVARACGLGEVRPQAMTVDDWLARIDPGGQVARLPASKRRKLIERSWEWPREHELVRNWFESGAVIDEALNSARTRQQLDRALWDALEQRRGYWALLIARAAHVLKSASAGHDWRSFVATAAALIDRRPLEEIPIMLHILGTSIAAWQAERNDPGDDKPRQSG